MTYKELKTVVLQLLNRYSIAGEQIPTDYNEQPDLLARIPALTKDALQYIASTTGRLRDITLLTDPSSMGKWYCYRLPDDCCRMVAGLLRKDGTRYWGYQILAGNRLLIPKQDKGDYLLEYFRYPAIPKGELQEEDFLDCLPQAQSAVCYYVAAQLAMEDNNFLYSALYQEFERRLARLQEGVTAEPGTVVDAYGS